MLMTRVGRAREMGETQGFMKVVVDADSKELLGAAILGLNGDEVVHSLLDVMYAKKPYTTISRARPTRVMGILERSSLRPLFIASASLMPTRPSGGSMNSA